MNELRTARLTLAPVDPHNARELWRVLAFPDLRRFQDIPRVRVEEFERQVRARPRTLGARVPGRFEWLVRGELPLGAIGWISLRVNDRTPDVGEVGYSLIEAARGRGYATEALGAVIDEAFACAELNEVQACCVPENASSRAVLDLTGFREGRIVRGGATIRGRNVDVMLYTMHRAEWMRARPGTISGTV
jgi:[ribosomal protein S5]-alanine N-acetyltransferase